MTPGPRHFRLSSRIENLCSIRTISIIRCPYGTIGKRQKTKNKRMKVLHTTTNYLVSWTPFMYPSDDSLELYLSVFWIDDSNIP